jgi:hypothetical protein
MGRFPHKKSRFYQAVTATPGLASAYRSGLKAIQPSDKAKITCRNPRKLTGSVCVDAALKQTMPTEPRWDYAIGYQGDNTEEIVWVEVHPASSNNHPKEMSKKLDWLAGWLADEGKAMNYRQYRMVWVSSGHISFRNNDPELRRLRDRGLKFVGSHLAL